MRFSIITVVYNGADCIKETIDSILDQSFKDYEIVIIDGGSTDGTRRVVRNRIRNRLANIRWSLISEKDSGIYDAMNKGVSRACGEYVYFLNAGDIFKTDDVLKKTDVFMENKGIDLVCGDVVYRYEDRDEYIDYKNHPRLSRFWIGIGIGTCHQAVFIRRDVMLQHPFDTSYRYLADQELFAYIISCGMSIGYSGVCVAVYDTNGFSSKDNNGSSRKENDRINCCYNKVWYIVWRFPKWIVRKLGSIIKA